MLGLFFFVTERGVTMGNEKKKMHKIPYLMDRLEVGRSTAYALVNSGEIVSVKHKRVVRVSEEAIDAWIERKEAESQQAK